MAAGAPLRLFYFRGLMLNVILCAVIILTPATTTQEETELLARMITAEARGEPEAGQAAVAWVAVNRAQAGGWFGDSLEAVLRKRGQFALHRHYTTQALRIASDVLSGATGDATDGATHFYAARTQAPSWAVTFVHTATIGGHKFYRNRRASDG